jgi:hypothetical protein
MRAPQVLPWLTQAVGAEEDNDAVRWGGLGRAPPRRVPAGPRRQRAGRQADPRRAGRGDRAARAHAQDPTQVAVGIETDRGLLVGALLAAGYQVSAVNPQVVGRSRGRHRVWWAKSDRTDAKVLPRPGPHRPAQPPPGRRGHPRRPRGGQGPGPRPPGPALGAAAARECAAQRAAGVLPGRAHPRWAPSWPSRKALAVLTLAPTPEQGRQLTRAAARRALVGAGRRRNLRARVVAVHDALAAPQLPRASAGRGRLPRGGGRPGGDALLLQRAGRRGGGAAWGPVRRPPGRRDHPKPARARDGAGRQGAGLGSATTPTATPPPRAARRSPAPPR